MGCCWGSAGAVCFFWVGGRAELDCKGWGWDSKIFGLRKCDRKEVGVRSRSEKSHGRGGEHITPIWGGESPGHGVGHFGPSGGLMDRRSQKSRVGADTGFTCARSVPEVLDESFLLEPSFGATSVLYIASRCPSVG